VVSREGSGSAAASLTGAEFDRLVDYLADALEPHDAAQVRRLVTEEPRWSSAHTALVRSDALVRDALAGAAVPAVAMPADVAARIDDALRDLARTPDLDSVPSVAGLDSVVIVPSSVSSLAAARARRRRLISTISAAAAAVVAVVGGVSVAANRFGAADKAASTSALDNAGPAQAPSPREAGSATDAPAMSLPGSATFLASGTNYSMETLGSAMAPLAAAAEPAEGAGRSTNIATPQYAGNIATPQYADKQLGPVPPAVRDGAPVALTRLLDPAALSACLDAIRTFTPGWVATIDYARFAGEPALVVLVRSGVTSTAVAVGPDCGRSGADQKGSASGP
jgi:hypothetical protein